MKQNKEDIEELYVLTDGTHLYDSKEMSAIEASHANAHLNGDAIWLKSNPKEDA